MTDTRIVGAVVDTERLILYREDGVRIILQQGDARIRPILDKVMPILNAGGVATISLEQHNHYAEFEKKTNGLVRLFRVAKKVVSHLIGTDEDRIPTQSAGQIPGAVVDSNSLTQQAAIDEIMAHAEPVSASSFKESDTQENQTMVAVIGEGKDAKVIPGVEGLKTQMAHSNKLGSTKGVQALLARLGKVVEKRGHSVQDVMRFLEKGDLPISDDGSIIAYKILKNNPNPDAEYTAQKGLFFDCHTGRIPQKVGSFVRVDESLVDRNRRNACSNGLHIARRGYLGNFSGDVCVLVKIAPEDVVTVPHGDANKVRVCAYHILGVIPDHEFRNLKSNKPMTEDSFCQQLLGQAISGQHIDKLEEVLVTGQSGHGVQLTSLVKGQAEPAKSQVKEVPRAKAIPDPVMENKDQAVDPKAVSKASQEQKGTAQPSRAELAKQLVERMADQDLPDAQRKEAAEALVALKKRTKVSYAALGLSGVSIRLLGSVLEGNIPQKPAPKTPKPAPAVKQVAATAQKAIKEVKAPPPATKKAVEDDPKDGPRQKEAKRLYNNMMDPNWNELKRAQFAQNLLDHKKKSKISFISMGLPQETSKQIEALIRRN